MSVDSVGRAGGFIELAHEGYSIGSELAVLTLETQENQRQCDRERLDDARSDYAEALREEVAAMHEEADHIATGAWVQGLTTVASGAAGFAAVEASKTTDKLTGWQVVHRGLGDFAQPLGSYAGGSAAAHDRADARAAAGEAEQAKWLLTDLKDALREAEERQDKALDWASSLADKDGAAINAVLSNMA